MSGDSQVEHEVVVIATGVANVASVEAAFRRLGATVRLSTDPGDVTAADRVVLPGVGSFAAGMDRLEAAGLVPVVRERIVAGRPTLAICLGAQLLAAESEESPGVHGVGVWPEVTVKRLAGPPGWSGSLPHLGWNRVEPLSDLARGGEPASVSLEAGYAYFANSFGLPALPDGWSGAFSMHGFPFVAAVTRGAVLACQFHPELSGAYGQSLLARWLQQEAVSSC